MKFQQNIVQHIADTNYANFSEISTITAQSVQFELNHYHFSAMNATSAKYCWKYSGYILEKFQRKAVHNIVDVHFS